MNPNDQLPKRPYLLHSISRNSFAYQTGVPGHLDPHQCPPSWSPAGPCCGLSSGPCYRHLPGSCWPAHPRCCPDNSQSVAASKNSVSRTAAWFGQRRFQSWSWSSTQACAGTLLLHLDMTSSGGLMIFFYFDQLGVFQFWAKSLSFDLKYQLLIPRSCLPAWLVNCSWLHFCD